MILPRACRRRKLSPTAHAGKSVSISSVNSISLLSAMGRYRLTQSARHWRRSKGADLKVGVPCSSAAWSIISPTISRRASAACDKYPKAFFRSVSGRSFFCASSLMPTIAVSGVRISWLRWPINALFIRLASSASQRRWVRLNVMPPMAKTPVIASKPYNSRMLRSCLSRLFWNIVASWLTLMPPSTSPTCLPT